MVQQADQIEGIKQENESLKKQNEELQQKIKAIELKQANNEELEQLRKKVAIEEMAAEARKKLFAGLIAIWTALGIASVAGIIQFYNTVVNNIEKKLLEPKTFSRIEQQVTKQAKKEVAEQLSKEVSNNLVEEFKKDKDFQVKLTNAVVDKISKDPEFIGKIYGIATTTVNTTLQDVAKQAPNSTFSQAAEKAFNQKEYFVVAASSTDTKSLSILVSKSTNLGLKTQICPPKQGNRRSVLLVTNTQSIKLLLDAAKIVENKARTIDPTAYVLPTEPVGKVFFDPDKCK